MRLLSRYIFKQTAGAVLLILVSLTGMTWLAVALRQLELMTSQGQDIVRFLGMTTLAIPALMAFVAPLALLIASIHVLNRLNGDSELIVMTAGGMPSWSLLKPLGFLALLVAVAVSLVNHLVGPWSQRALREMVMEVRADFMSQVLQPWRFSSPERDLTVHIRDRSPSGDLLGLMLHDARDPKQVITYLAERARILKQGGSAFMVMEKGHVLRRMDNEPAPQIISFESYPVDLNQLDQRIEQTQQVWRPRERYTHELLDPALEAEARGGDKAQESLGSKGRQKDKDREKEKDRVKDGEKRKDRDGKLSVGRFSAELHERFSSPLYAFSFILIVIAFVGQAQTTRTNRMRALVTAFGVAVAVRILGIAAANAAAVSASAALMMYLVPIAAGAGAVVLILMNAYPRPPSRLGVAVAGRIRANNAAIASLWQRLRPGRRPGRSSMVTRS